MVARGVRSRAVRAHPFSDRLYSAPVRYDDHLQRIGSIDLVAVGAVAASELTGRYVDPSGEVPSGGKS